MDYTIYSYGSGEILEKVFNVLALLCQNESIFLRPVLALTATLGGVWAALRAIFGQNPSLFVRDWMLPTILIFNLLFVPRVTVNIVDNVDTFHHYMRIDNVPVGPALIGHVASNLSYFLTEKIEENLVPASYGDLTYGKTGPMFAANLMMASQDVTIADPVLRDNVKAYVDQCYTWPYLYTNISGKRDEALRTTNILDFMQANPHKGLGMYWKDASGQPTFCKCSEVPSKLKGGMDQECSKALSKIASQVLPGVSAQSRDQAQIAMNRVGESAWHAIAKDSSTAHKRVEQLMVINAAREAIDDGLERFGNERRFKRLISYSATRAEQQQNSGFLIAGLTAARQLPLLQGVFLSLLLVSFVVVSAFTFIPGGLKIWGMWIKMILWVESWPIFFGILNCIGLLWLDKSLSIITQSHEGITWISQSGLAESSWTAYCIVQNFFLAVPFLSWAIISQSGHALVSMAERALPTLGQALGQNIVDNNQIFDTQSFHNRSMGSIQMAQQSLGSNYSLGNTIDDGRFRTSTDSAGYQTVQENMSTTRHSINSNDALQAQFSQQLSHEQQAAENLSHNYADSRQATLSNSYDVVVSFAKGTSHVQGASEAENKDIQIAAQQAISATQRYADQHNLSERTAWEHKMSAGLPANFSGGILGANSSGSSSADNISTSQFTKEGGLSKETSERLNRGLSAALNNQVSFTDDYSKRAAESFQGSYAETKNYSDQYAAQKSKVDRLSEAGSILESRGFSMTENMNDDLLEYVATKRNVTKESAARWASENSAAFKEEASFYFKGWTENMTSWVSAKVGPLDSSTIDDQYRSYKQMTIHKGTEVNSSYLNEAKTQGENYEVSVKKGSEFEQKSQSFYDAKKEKVTFDLSRFAASENKLNNTAEEIGHETKETKDLYLNKEDSSVLWRATEKGVTESWDTTVKATKTVLNIIPEKNKDEF